jgi:UDP-N-acetylglucosamine acyltransferase
MEIKRAYKILCREGNTLKNAKLEIFERLESCPELQILYDFICEESRGIVR